MHFWSVYGYLGEYFINEKKLKADILRKKKILILAVKQWGTKI